MAFEMTDLFTFESGTRQQSSERVTPHKLSILIMVNKFIRQKTPGDEIYQDVNPYTEEEKRVFMVTLLNLLQSPDMDLKSLRSHIDSVLKPCLLRSLYEFLRMISTVGVKPINDFFESNFKLLSANADIPGTVRRESIMGLYIRRMELAYSEMSFSQLVDLYKKIRLYYEAGFPENADNLREDPDSDDLDIDKIENPLGLSEHALHISHLNEKSVLETLIGQNCFSKKQAAYFIANQSMMLSHNEMKALPPDQLQEKITNILAANPDMAEAHFLSYINNLRLKEYCTALHNLYHYFDCKACTPNDGNTSKKKGSGDEVAMRYAALNLASLQFRFGNKNECKAALREAIRMAQESNDQVCLQHALVWLNLVEDNTTPSTQLERSIRKTIDLSLHSLTVLGLNSLSKQVGLGLEKPSKVISYFTQSNLINCTHSNYSMMSSGGVQRAAMWSYYGNRELNSLDSQIVLNLNTCVNGVFYSGEAVCIALCNMAQFHADTGQYSAAEEILNTARIKFPVNTSHAHIWQSCQQRIAFTRALLNGKLSDAEQSLVNLKAVDEPEAKIRKSRLLREKNQLTEAFACLDGLLKECEDSNEGFVADYKCRILLELSLLYVSSGNHTAAIPHITECTAHARRHHLQLYEALSAAYLAYVQLCIGLPKQGMRLIEAHLPKVLANATFFDKARVLYTYARCKVAAAEAISDEVVKKTELKTAQAIMSKVSALFASVEAHRWEKDAMYYQALLHNMRGDTQGRNRCAHRFGVLDKLYPTLSSLTVNVL